MLLIPINLVHADTGKVETLGTIAITNQGGTRERANYLASAMLKGETYCPEDAFYYWGEVEDWPRLERNAIELLHAVLGAMLEESKGVEDGHTP